MSEHFGRISIEHLYHWILQESKYGSIFGVTRDLFYRADSKLYLNRFDQTLHSPLGVAAGPHSQMAQNLIVAWLVGCRFMELKTIQTLDRLSITKPCIDMRDEGYNCEWSQELTCEDSFDEYLNAWILIHLLQQELFPELEHPGVIFNMSVGYDMKGISNPNVQKFLDRMKDAADTIQGKLDSLRKQFPKCPQIEIPSCISNNVTLSTMHGCPAEEIETIARYLMQERGLHTAIKLNPTLLGPQALRDILERHQFRTQVPDEAFEHDPSFEDAVGIIERLTKVAEACHLQFSVKLTNTLEVLNRESVLPNQEKQVYLSGRAIHPISVGVAARLQQHFHGQLDLSFAGGADCFNIRDLVRCGLAPITVCSDLLKPGGYGRMAQYLDHLTSWDEVETHLLANQAGPKWQKALHAYAAQTIDEKPYQKTSESYHHIKTGRRLNAFDCVAAPCVSTCPSTQHIPGYLRAVAEGDLAKAYAIITETNPFPGVTGMVCDHTCQSKCTRQNLDESLRIRDIKRFVEESYREGVPQERANPTGKRVAIIGAGPCGLSAGYSLAMNGLEVHVFEAGSKSGGMAASAIPVFRLTDDTLDRDLERIMASGVQIHFNHPIKPTEFQTLRQQFDFVIIAIGANRAKKMNIPGVEARGVMDQLLFLQRVREQHELKIGPNTVVIGGGNSAVDAARTAWRLTPPGGKVTLVYRRTEHEMPAEPQEIAALKGEGVKILELASPVEVYSREDRVTAMKFQKMKLGEPDDSGRRRPVPIEDSDFELKADTVISALGQDIHIPFLEPRHILPKSRKTALPGVFLGGDAGHGASSVIQAVGDGLNIAKIIMDEVAPTSQPEKVSPVFGRDHSSTIQQQMSWRQYPSLSSDPDAADEKNFELVSTTLTPDQAMNEAKRCLSCDLACDVCVSVCPNRANWSYDVASCSLQAPILQLGENGTVETVGHEPFQILQQRQVLNIGDFCNECGNCTSFCPTSGRPFADKPTFYLTETSFSQVSDGLFFEGQRLLRKSHDKVETLQKLDSTWTYESNDWQISLDGSTKRIQKADSKPNSTEPFKSSTLFEMLFLYEALEDAPFLYTGVS